MVRRSFRDDSKNSLLMLRITGEHSPRMPIGGSPLAPQEIAILRDWIDQGARRAPDAPPAKARWMPPLALCNARDSRGRLA